MVGFVKRSPSQLLASASPDWFTPLLDPGAYKPLKPKRREEVWSGGEGLIVAARVPDWLSAPQASYAAARALAEELAASLKEVGKVLVKPDASVSAAPFLGGELKRLARQRGVSEHADLQALAAQPALLAGVVDALLEAGADEVDIALDSPWFNPMRVAFELGYARAFADPKYEGRVFFVDLYEGQELERLPLKWAEGYDTGFFAHVEPPRALFAERYDLVMAVTPAKTHALAVYSLALKPLSAWRRPQTRWHMLGAPLKLFDREYASEALGVDVPPHRSFEVIPAGDRVILSNGFASSAPLPTCVEEGELLAVSDPHAGPASFAPMLLSMGFYIVRYVGAYATVADELKGSGTEVAALVSGIVAMEGEGPLAYGERRFAGFAVAGTSPLAVEAFALDAMFGSGRRGFEGVVQRVNRSFCNRYVTDEELEEEVMMEAADPWTLRLAEELAREERDVTRYTLSVLSFDEWEEVRAPWDLRLGPPFKLPKHVYLPPRTLMRCVYAEGRLFRRALSQVDKGISTPLPGMIGA
ncbi:MAG: DUF362 domain-containing protein [Thermofilum sp.]|nr:DUF362 domain-containing protein [Thermofilum sp.]MCC6065468.1 DUF362 domain-containing protein [Thermofilum sp.]